MEAQRKEREQLLSLAQSFIESVLIPLQMMFRKQLSSMQLHVLLCLRKRGPCTMSELADTLNISRQQTTQIVDRVHEMGLVERVREEKDRRVVRIQWTEEGDRYFKPLCDRYFAEMDARVQALPPEDAQAFMSAVTTLARLLPRIAGERGNAE